jgi:purine-nucleoside/S-methyl-5'-thioadenosine phosphorylase / adenosine deaminase
MTAPLEADCLSAVAGIRHGFFTRTGGVSEGIYRGLNCGRGSKDDRVCVNDNRSRVATHLQARHDDVLTPYQIHSSKAVIVDQPLAFEDLPKADAVVTATPGLAIGVLTADCGPVLLSNRQGTVVGAAHAGWRGAVGGIIEATIAAMQELGAERQDLVAAIGPMIGAAAYEVGPEFEVQFLSEDPKNAKFFKRKGPKQRPTFDLAAFVHQRLQRCGITTLELVSPCTLANESLFYSYRRSQAQGHSDYGRQISAIVVA